MKFFAIVVLIAFGAAAVQSESIVERWEAKAQALMAKFHNYVEKKAAKVVIEIRDAQSRLGNKVLNFLEDEEREIKSDVTSAMNDLEMMVEGIDIECYKNASKELILVEQAATAHLLSCQNLTSARQDLEEIAKNASTVAMDVVQDAKLIMQAVGTCGVQVGLARWECVFKFVSLTVKKLIQQWPDAQAFIEKARILGADFELQINTCMKDPTQVSLDKAIQKAVNGFYGCANSTAPTWSLE